MLKMHSKTFIRNRYIWALAFIIGLLWKFITGYFSNAIDVYTTTKIKNYAEDVIITSIEEEILDNVSDSDFLVESYDSQGKVSYAYFDTQKINLVRNTIAKYMDNIINRIEHHQDLQKIDIPIAYFLGTKYFLSNSFKIPISLEVVGNQDIDIKTEKIVSGLNTTIFEINLVIAVEIYVVIPFQSKKIETSTQIPIAIEILNNEIPYYYSDKQV